MMNQDQELEIRPSSALDADAPGADATGDTEGEAADGVTGNTDSEYLGELWSAVLGKLQQESAIPSLDHYVDHLKPVQVTEDRFVLQAPSDFIKDWLMRRFARRIEDGLQQVLGHKVGLYIQSPQGTGVMSGSGPASDNGEARGAETAPPRTRSGRTPTVARRPARPAGDMTGLEDFSSSPLNRKYTFDNFIVGRSNYVSHAAAWAVANAPAKGQYNPLFIYGGVGLGKTHLMQAIGHYIKSNQQSNAEIVYVSGENFLYQVVRCIREDKMVAFRRMYRNVDIWLVDDIQYICNAERTEVEFFHIFNTLYDQGKQIVICSDKAPKDLQLTESRLKSRFEWGLISYIEPPDLEHRIAILQKRAQNEGVQVDPLVLQFLAERIRTNIRSLEGALTRLLAMSALDGRKINLDLAAETVRFYSTSESEPVRVDVQTIIQVVSDHFKIPVRDILGKKRNKEIVVPRQVAMYLAREMAAMSYPDIGRSFGRDYTTVIHSYEKIKGEVTRDPTMKNIISEVRSKAHARS